MYTGWRDTYVLTIQTNPVGDCQSIDEDSEERLVVGICNARQVRIIVYAQMQRLVPAHVARYNPVVAAPVLNIVRERVVEGVGGGFGCI